MPWWSVTPMDEKIRFISDYLSKVFNFSELCERYNISRKTGYKWVERYHEEGANGLADRSQRPENNPRRTPAHIEKAILEVNEKHPSWGAKKIIKILIHCHAILALPALSPSFRHLFATTTS